MTESSLRNGIDVVALAATKESVRATPSLASVTFQLESTWIDGCRQAGVTGNVVQDGEVVTSRTARYSLESDEPAALLGTDKAASPGEYVLQALAGCYTVTYAASAAARGIVLDRLEFDLEADFDLRGFLGVDDTVAPGAQQIRVNVRAASSNASRADLESLTQAVQRHSPIRDTLSRAVDVVTTLA